MLLAVAGAMYAQTSATWDNSGNSMLSGTYYFRQVAYSIGDSTGDLNDAIALYGIITFDGNGNWSINGNGANGGVAYVDAANSGSNGLPIVTGLTATTGTYTIGGSGYGSISSPLITGDVVIGLVSANGVFVGSSTDNANGYNDMFIAAKLASPAPTNSSFTGNWTLSDFDPNYSGGLAVQYMQNTIFAISPDGNGHLNPAGAINIRGFTNGSTQPYTQTASGIPYFFSNGAAVATFPSNGTLIYGQKYFYYSTDGNFLFGGAPQGFDMIVGVKATSSTPALSGLYYQVGLAESIVNNSFGDLDTYFGSFYAIAGAAPQTLLGHQRVNDFGGAANLAAGANLYDYTYTSPISISGNEASNSTTGFIVGDGGAVMITTGLGGALDLSVSLQAPTPTGTGVYLNPTGVVNSASNAPFTARIAPGELLTLYGSNLAPSTQVAGIPFPTTGLNGVQVTIGGYPAAIYYVSATQISAIVPYEVTVGTVVGIQVNNKGTLSNTVTQYVSNTAPGVFTQNQSGTDYGEIEHLGIGNTVSATGSVVTDGNPAVEGETLAAYLTGLGDVSPTIADGAAGPSPTPSATTHTIAVDFNGVAGTNLFSGLAPTYSGLYQLNFTIPATGITVGPNYLDVAGYYASGTSEYLDSYMSYLLLPIEATPSTTTTADTKAQFATPTKFHRAPPADRSAKLPVRKIFSQLHGGTENQ
jgi:uncharacterized protein (TIGR03437 family)